MNNQNPLSNSPESEAPIISPDDLRSWIIFEDDDLIALNKPGGIVCHPSKSGPWSSLVGACREFFNLETIHLVHRLDRETSGLILMAKHRRSARITQMAFQNRQVSKTYLTILEGDLSEKTSVKQHLARDLESPVHIRQTVRKSNSSQSAETIFEPLAFSENHTFARVIPITGRKHQIRAHAFWLGHPVVADKIYGPDDTLYLEFIENGWTDRMEKSLPLRNHALHAFSLSFDLPGLTRTFTAPLPPEFRNFLTGTLKLENPEALLSNLANDPQ